MKRKIGWLIVIIVIAAGIGLYMQMGTKPLAVTTEPVVTGTLEQYVEETAEVKMEDSSSVYAANAGIATQVNVVVGDKVKKGQLLVMLDTEASALQIKDLKAQMAVVNAQYSEAKNPVLTSEINKAKTQVEYAQAAYDSAKQTADMQKQLSESGAVSQEVYRLSLLDLAAKEANLDTSKSNLNLLNRGLSSNVKAQYVAQLDSLKAKLSLLEKQQNDLGYKAPMAGVVLSAYVEKGSYLQLGKLLIEIGNTGLLYLKCDVLAEDMAGVKVGTQVRIENKDLNLMDLSGSVRKIYPTAFSKLSELGISQKRVTVEIALDKSAPELKAGYEVTAKLIVLKNENTLLINKKALFEHQGQDAVFIVENGMSALRVVQKGIENDDQVEIVSGLKAGEQVILSPEDTLKEGSRVE